MSYFYFNSLNIRKKGHLIQLMDRALRAMLMFLPHIVTCPTMKQCKLTKTANKQSNQIKPRNLSNFIYSRENEQPSGAPILYFFLQNISCLKENNIIKLISTISIFFPIVWTIVRMDLNSLTIKKEQLCNQVNKPSRCEGILASHYIS